MSDTTKKIIRHIAMIFVYYRTNISKVITALICIFILNDWIKTDNSPSWFLAAVIILIVYPVFYLVFSALMLIPYTIGLIILKVIKDDDYDSFDENYYGYYSYRYDAGRNTQQNYYQSNQQAENNYKESKQKNYNQNQNQEKSYNQHQEYKQQKNNDYHQQGSRNNQKNSRQGSGVASEYEKALKFYGLQMPFTKEELKNKRRQLMKKAHPDAGGNTEEAEKVNVYYDILIKYAN